MSRQRRVALVGGGISGVTAAWELSRAPEQHRPQFTLFEASQPLGGIVETVHEAGFTVECGPDSWVSEKPWARELALELGLADEIISSQDHVRRTYLLQGGTLEPLPDRMRMMVPTRWEPLLQSGLFSSAAKLAYRREPERAEELKQTALAQRGDDGDESVADFVRRHFGAEVTETVAAPLLSGVFGGDVERLSVRAVMAPFVRMEQEHGSLINALHARGADSGQSIFTSLRGGLGTLIDRMIAALPAEALRCGEAVRSIAQEGSAWRVVTAHRAYLFDAVLLATSLDPTRALLRTAGTPAASRIADLLPDEASSCVVAALGFAPAAAAHLRIPQGFGFLVPPQSATRGSADSLLACTFMEQKFPQRAPAGGVLLRAFYGGAAAEHLEARDDRDIIAHGREQLAQILGPLPTPAVQVVRRWPRSLPQYAVGHLNRMRAMEKELNALPGLTLLGNAYRGVGLGDLVRDARAAARAFIQ